MKKLMICIFILAVTANTSFATSYWFDYCHEEEVALAQAKKDYPNLAFNGDCDRISEIGKPAIFTGLTAICDPSLVSVKFYGMGNAVYKVLILDPETHTMLQYRVIMRSHGGGCKTKKVTEENL
jgi:hypothetical protein